MAAITGYAGVSGGRSATSVRRADQRKLRGPYRPPQYRKVMLPLIVQRRLDCVLEPTKDNVLKEVAALKARKLSPEAIEKAQSSTPDKTP